MRAPTEAYEYLHARGFMKGEEKVDRGAITTAIIQTLVANPVRSNDMAEVQDKALTVAELRSQILGQPDDEDVEADLDDIVTSLTSVSTKGRVQSSLENGYVLLSAPVTRTIVNGETESSMKRNGRFLTENIDLIETFWWNKQAARAESDVQEYKARQEVGIRRQPQLQARLTLNISRLHNAMALQLQIPEQT